MKDVSFHEIVISRDDQKIVSADVWVYSQLGSYVEKPMNELIAPEDSEIYKNNIKNCDGQWYPSKIIAPDNMYYTYMRAENVNDRLIRLTVVDAKDLLYAHSVLVKSMNMLTVQLSMYEDVFFEYDKASDTVDVYNTELAEFDSGSYSLDEFEKLLMVRATKEQARTIKGFFSQVRSGVGRSMVMVEGNILNEDPDVTHTVLDEAFAFYDENTEGVVGHIQLRRSKGNFKSTVIKHDSLTGLIDKTDIIRIAKERIDDRRLEGTALAIIDIDYFKNINDTYGHHFGDEVIKKVADIISNEVGNSGVSGRFGGDEFFVVFYNIEFEDQLRTVLRGIKTKVSSTFPDKGIDRDNPLSVSIGTAVFSKDADNYEDLFMLADHCLYVAKEKGRNRYIIYTQEKHGTLEAIKLKQKSYKKINDRDVAYGDVIVRMFDLTLHDEGGSLENFMSKFADAFDLQNVMLFAGEPFRFVYSAGSKAVEDQTAIDFVLDILNGDTKDKYFTFGEFVVINRLEMLPPYAYGIKAFLKKREIQSLIILRFYDADKKECILIISTVGRKNQWNSTHFKYYRAFADLLSLQSVWAADKNNNA